MARVGTGPESAASCEADALSRRVVLPPLVTLNGLCGLAVTPDGSPLTIACTSPEKPLSACTLT